MTKIKKNVKTFFTSMLKTGPRITREIGYILCRVHVWKWPITHQNKAKNLCTIYFAFDLDGECKFIKTKHYSD